MAEAIKAIAAAIESLATAVKYNADYGKGGRYRR